MDSSHKLDAPNNEELRTIEHLDDRSGLTTLYRKPGQQFEGEILSSADREKAKAEQLEAITSGIGKHVIKVGLAIPYPFISGLMLIVFLYTSASWANAMLFAVLIILSVILWGFTSYTAYASIFKLFYKHALRAGPYLIIALISVLMGSQAIYGYVKDHIGSQSLLFNAALISLLILLYSLIVNYILLGIWGNSHLRSATKALVSGTLIAISGFLVLLVYLF